MVDIPFNHTSKQYCEVQALHFLFLNIIDVTISNNEASLHGHNWNLAQVMQQLLFGLPHSLTSMRGGKIKIVFWLMFKVANVGFW